MTQKSSINYFQKALPFIPKYKDNQNSGLNWYSFIAYYDLNVKLIYQPGSAIIYYRDDASKSYNNTRNEMNETVQRYAKRLLIVDTLENL